MDSEQSSVFNAVATKTNGSCCSIDTVFTGGASRSKRQRPPPDDLSSLVASEMNKLSFKERQTVYEDLHAVSSLPSKSEEELKRLIAEMKECITSIRKNKQAYNKAAFLNPEYVESFDFMYMFLVYEKFNAAAAAKKVVDHFAFKLDLFGPNLLAKKITFDDLSDDDKDSLLTGSFQILPRDRAKRRIILCVVSSHKYKTVENQLRAMWYIFMLCLQEKETQQHGLVFLTYLLGQGGDFSSLDFHYRASIIGQALPVNARGFHFCYDNEIYRPFLYAMQIAVGDKIRLRFRSHFGSHVEIQYSLQTFGISSSILPITKRGDISMDTFNRYISEQIEKERQEKARYGDKIFHPLTNDVLFGRGRHPQEHLGNIYLASLVDEYKEVYRDAKKNEKKPLHRMLVKKIQEAGGRFLKRSGVVGDDGWIEVDDDTSADKVGHRFREAQKLRRRY